MHNPINTHRNSTNPHRSNSISKQQLPTYNPTSPNPSNICNNHDNKHKANKKGARGRTNKPKTKPCKPPYTTGTTPDLPHPYPALIRCCRLAATEALPPPSRYCRRPIRQSSRHLHCPRNNLSPPPYTT
ncbi:hypothetical protein PCANC_09258 [Puccinia coronata f. sp. avenae]|uniref:Uncharacterized protein n=1 Tax=Puccinia coronata f. sp. avenae TaxID=200324 RepID=A0A2N5T2Z7_9BASI|nr:hypothetical protein PCANC_09258 [Puccinia coronata f. sp. avenae]